MTKPKQMLSSMPSRNPIEGTFELTIRCNLHCKMCLFRHADSENAKLMAEELTAEQWIDMARQVAEAGTLQLLITGGEPLIRPDFCEIWEGIYKQGFIITLYTNATLVTPRIIETLQKYPPHKIGVTVYGASPETYKMVTGSAAAFEQTLAGIRQLKKLPSKMEYRMTVIKDNYNDVDTVEDMLREAFDLKSPLITTRIVTKAVRGACADVEACRLPAEKNCELSLKRTIKRLKEAVGDRFSEGQISISYEKSCQDPTGKQTVSLFGCNAGMKTYTVSWDGCLLGCQIMEAFAKKIKGNFAKAWEDFPYGVRLPKVSDKCEHCTLGEFCSLCPAFRYAETGTFSEAPSYICRDAEAFKRLAYNNERDENYFIKY